MKRPRILCFCSYVPARMLGRLGLEMICASEAGLSMLPEDRLGYLSKSVCSYMQFCGAIDYAQYDGVIIANCCCSSQRLYDYIQFQYPAIFCHLIELPGSLDARGTDLLLSEYEKLQDRLCQHFSLFKNNDCVSVPLPLAQVPARSLWVLGSGVHPALLAELGQLFQGYVLYPIDCFSTGRGDRIFYSRRQTEPHPVEPCVRMLDFLPWLSRQFGIHRQKIAGVIAFASQKCDHGLFALPAIGRICTENDCPVLVMEEEFSAGHIERNRIRYEAFFESAFQ